MPLPDGWTTTVQVDRHCVDGLQLYHADVFRAGPWGCRMSLSGNFPDQAAAQGALAHRMQAWLGDYESQPHTGDSGFQLP